jgi:hypothetical protein
MENQHLLDATEIFRKLNVHKKVCSAHNDANGLRRALLRLDMKANEEL